MTGGLKVIWRGLKSLLHSGNDVARPPSFVADVGSAYISDVSVGSKTRLGLVSGKSSSTICIFHSQTGGVDKGLY
jgi:hypothetical protein